MAPRHTQIRTKDNYELTDVLMDGFNTFDVYNDDVDKPFREMFTRSVSERVFQTDRYGKMPWDEIAEGEHMGTGSTEDFEQFMSVAEYGRALGWNRQYIERHTREELNRDFTKLAEGYDEMEHDMILAQLFSAAADGSELWFQPPDKGSYGFTKTHNHTFGSTDALFAEDEFTDQSYAAGAAHTPTKHIRVAANHLKHHQKSPRLALVSSQFAEQFKDEIAWEADYYFPMASDIRERGLSDDAMVDGVRLMETPWLNDLETADQYQFYVVSDDDPIARNEEVAPTLAANESGAPLNRADQIFNAHGYARFGLAVEDPLSVVSVTADNLA